MGKVYADIDTSLRSFIEAQHVFFVATAPLDRSGHVNVSPKGLDTLRVIGPHTVAYLDYVGSGAETIAHLRENGRIVIMLCAFAGPPKIVRLHGRGEAFEPQDSEYGQLRGLFPEFPSGRTVIRIAVDRISDSCGYGVPGYAYEGERTQLPNWAERKGSQGLADYQKEKNRMSVDNLPALHWVEQAEAELG
jgi:Pyridoxamine 5'-phosphate oxidase